ncbi:MAG: methionine--tRNA ligase [Chloroflexi bacterium]|nr:methionine--tRNA ligase [Chloroflexota bacterium]
MAERILIGVAWPYANGSLHLGHIAGAYLAPDIFARYHRLKGHEVLMVSGSDMHGTPITIRAEQEGKTPQDVANFWHREFMECWQKLGISFDLYTSTETENHRKVVHDIFLSLLKKGFIFKDSTPQPYCPQCRRFLPDRYVEGNCPLCGFTGARGDQCDRCGKPLNPVDLVDSKCRICGAHPEMTDSEHYFLRLTAFQSRLLDWVKKQTHWRPNVLNFTQRYLEEGLKDRAITRDIEWGIPVPVEGFEKKRIYVWFEAVIGYLSASIEWAGGQPEKWRPFWEGDAKAYYFIGKDNIPFNTIIWPAMLMGYEGHSLPYDVPANEFLTLQGGKFSTSRNWAVWLPDYLARYDPDPLRYLLSANMPETSDADFSWQEFFRRNNDELVATYGNLAHRVLTYVQRNFDAAVPHPGPLNGTDQALLTKAEAAFNAVEQSLAACRFREAIRAAMTLAQEANRYLDDTAPWKNKDKAAAGTSLYVAISTISCLKTLLYPFLPFSSQKLHEYLGFQGAVEAGGWQWQKPSPGQPLPKPKPLFTKLEEELVEAETAKMGRA